MLFDVMRSINSMYLILGKSWEILKMFNGVNIMLILFLYLCFIIVKIFFWCGGKCIFDIKRLK